MKYIFLSLFLFCAFHLSATTYYVASGSTACGGSACVDTNNGTTKTTAWAHAPGMQTCTNTCSSTTIHAGDSIILRGGDTWPNASYMWNLPGGSSGNPTYIGVDKTWFAGGSWVRPILDAGGVVISNNFDTMFNVGGWVTFDNFEIKGFFWNNAACSGAPFGQCGFFNQGQHDGGVFENLYIHGWTHAGTNSLTNNGVINVFSGNGGTHSSVHDSVIDGTDVATDHSVTAFFSGPATVYNMWIRQVASAFIVSTYGVGVAVYHDNHIEDIGPAYCNVNPSNPGNCTHENGFEDNGDIGLYFYNNTISNVSLGLALWVAPNPTYTAYVFNNVIYAVHDTQILDVPAPPIYDSSLCSSGPNGQGYCNYGGNIVLYNNTVQCGDDTTQYLTGCTNGLTPSGSSGTNTYLSENNHFIALNLTGTGCGSTPNCTFTSNTVQTQATANGQGYTSSQTFAFSPTSSGNSTVGAGTNLTSSCSGNLSTLCRDTTYACSDSSNTASCPARTTNARPSSGAWNSGAYQYVNPTYTITISSIIGSGTVTSSDSVINCTTGTSGTCVDSTALGTVTLTETPASGFVFAGWGGGTCSGTATTCSVTTTATVTARFLDIYTTYGTGFGVGYTVLGAPVVTGIATLPQQWATKIIHPNFTTTRTLGAGGFYACTTGDTCFAKLQQAYCDWAFDGVDDSWLISIHAGTFAQTGLGHTCTQTGATVYKSLTIIPKIISGHQPKGWIVFDSDNPLPEGQTVCSHGTDDNATRQPPSGDISTWWTGTNWGCANDYASFWIFEADWILAGNAGALIQGGQWDATTNLGPANIVFRNAHFRQTVGAVITSDMVKPSYGNLATMTIATQGPTNWHFENIYATGDAKDWCNQVGGITQYGPNATGSGYAVNDTFTIAGGTSTATGKVVAIGPGSAVKRVTITFGGGGYSIATGVSTTNTIGSGTGLTLNIYAVAGSSPSCVTSFNTGGPGANVASNMFELSDCINCTLKYSYTDYITRAGAEGHIIGIRRGIGPIAIVHNWLSGQSINIITGGEASSDPLYYLQNLEYRGNRNTEPPSLIGTGYQGPTGGSGITFKNRQEFKDGQYVLIDGNIWEYSDTSGGQSGQCLELNPRGCSNNAQCDNTQVALQDFTVTNNICRHALSGFALVGRSSYPANGGGVTNPLRRVNANNNLLYDLGNTNNYDHLNVVTQPYSIRFETGDNAFICNGTNSSGTITLTCLHGPPGLSQTNISPGDYFIVQGCSDSTWNLPSSNFQYTIGATALTGTVPGGFTVVYQNNSAVSSTATGCVVQSGESHPSNVSITHNTFIMDSTQASQDGAAIYTGTIPKAWSDTGCASAGPMNSTAITALSRAGNIVTATVASTTGWDVTLGTGSQTQAIVEVTGVTPSDFNGNFYYLGQVGGNLTWMQTGANETGTAFGTAAQMGTQCPYNLFAQNITAKDNLIAVNSTAGPSCPTPSVGWNGWLEQGGSNLEGCPSGFNATGCSENTLDSTTSTATYTDFPGRCSTKYTEMGGANAGANPPVTLFFPASSVCSGSTATSACVGMKTMMSGAAFDGNDSNFLNYVLDPSSTFHNAADDGTDYGANPAAIESAINSKLYTCASYCGTGPQPDSPQ